MIEREKQKPPAPETTQHTIVSWLPVDEAHRRLAFFLGEMGYTPIEVSEPYAVYERAPQWLTLLWLSPRGLRTRLRAHIWADASHETLIALEVVPLPPENSGIVILEADWDFWYLELLELEHAMKYGRLDVSSSREAARLASWRGFMHSLPAVLTLLFFVALIVAIIVALA